jgi:uncharacterized Zn finger protein
MTQLGDEGAPSILNTSLANFTWDDLRQWAGSKILGRGKSYLKNVYDLARTESGGLVAWVSGSEDYATSVEVDEDGELDWFCSCPYDWGPCKHAVAVILAGLEQAKNGGLIPLVDKEGELFLAILGHADEDDEEFWDENDADDLDEDEAPPEPGKRGKSGGRGKEPALTGILEKKSREELLELLVNFAARHPEVKRSILEADQLQSGKIDKLASALRKEIKAVTSEEAWYNPWKGEGHRPDYSHIKEQLAALLQQGHADTVAELGLELWKGGNAQVAESHDEGDTASEIGECLEIVFQAVTASALSRPEQLLWMIDIFLEDQLAISDSCERFIRGRIYGKEDWGAVARSLQARLKNMPAPRADSYSSRYDRETVMNWLINAFERSGQKDKVLPLLEQEAHATQCYSRLADRFLQAGQPEKAREWCIEGFRKTAKESPGIASSLQNKLRELAGREKKFDMAAAYRVQDFFAQPSAANFTELKKAAEKIKCWPAVRAAVLHFLESGQRPDSPARNGKEPIWPLPRPEVAEEPDKRFPRQYPHQSALIDIAILEKRFDDVVQLYQAQQNQGRWGSGKGKEVAAAVSRTHPDVSLAIWKKVAEGEIRLVKPKAYEEAAIYLRKMRQVYQETNRLEEWRNLIRALRIEHKAKRRLLEVLDSLESKRIIER